MRGRPLTPKCPKCRGVDVVRLQDRTVTAAVFELLRGDCREIMATLDADSIDAIVCDPPYELGFMGRKWDAAGVAYDVGTWAAALRVLKPGAHLVAFGAPRTYHRMAVAIEDAGFEIRDSLMWLFGSGFPKSLNLKDDWQGWGTALKPAYEPIVMARKPLSGTVAANVAQWGTGGLNIDGTRIDSDGGHKRAYQPTNNARSVYGAQTGFEPTNADGRWPANILLDDEAAALLDAMSGERPGNSNENLYARERAEGDWAFTDRGIAGLGRNDTGGASRFFFVSKGETWQSNVRVAPIFCGSCGFALPVTDERTNSANGAGAAGGNDPAQATRFHYTSKTSKAEREFGLDDLEPVRRSDGREKDIENPRLRTNARRNDHPTVKPVDVMRWLCRLITPPGGTILDPFCGSGSTGMAALDEGFRFVGIDLDERYLEIARRRIARRHLIEPLPQRDSGQGVLL